MCINIRFPPPRLISVILFLYFYIPSFGQNISLSDANKEVITRYFYEVLNARNLNRLEEVLARDYTWHQMNGTDVQGNRDSAHIAAMKFVFTAIPDIQYTIESMVSEKDMVAVNSTITGTAKGELFGLPPTQKKVRFKQMFFFRLANNKITEEWEVVDLDGLKAQLSNQQ